MQKVQNRVARLILQINGEAQQSNNAVNLMMLGLTPLEQSAQVARIKNQKRIFEMDFPCNFMKCGSFDGNGSLNYQFNQDHDKLCDAVETYSTSQKIQNILGEGELSKKSVTKHQHEALRSMYCNKAESSLRGEHKSNRSGRERACKRLKSQESHQVR